MPKSISGKWSLGLIILMPVLFFIGTSFANAFYDSVTAGNTLWADVVNRPGVALPMMAGFGAGLTALITGLVALVKQKERAILVYASTLIGALLIVFLIAEFISPH